MEMTHTYSIHGMSCNGCRSRVESFLNSMEDVETATVDLKKGEAVVTMKKHLDINDYQTAFKDADLHYQITLQGDKSHEHTAPKETMIPKRNGTGTFYCPMHCEGEKTYDKAGDCPVCGMDLVEEVSLVSMSEDGEEDKTYMALLRKFWIALAFTLPIFIIAMSDMILNNPLHQVMSMKNWNWIQLALSIPVVFYATWMFFQRAWRSILTWNLNMFTLIGIGASVAWLFSIVGLLFPDLFPDQFKTQNDDVHVYFEAATVILTLVLMGQLLEAKAHSKTNSAVKELLKLAPNTAFKIIDGVEHEISINEILLGDILRVKPGDKIPVDGSIIEGKSTIDQSMITGESLPVDKEVGDTVNSGTINGNQTFLMKAERIGADTLLSQIVQMVNDASRSRAPIQNLADKVSGYFVPIVVTISIITFIAWSIWGPEPALVFAFVNAIAVLIIACPCALGLATPMSVMVGVGKGAQSGVLIKNAEALERMNEIDTLIVDKTGTLTEGKPSVTKVLSLDANLSENELLQYIASLNQMSEHPLAAATVKFAHEKKINLWAAIDFSAVAGKGVKGIVNQKKIAIGNDKMMEYANVQLTHEIIEKAEEFQLQGNTVSYVNIEGKIVGLIALGDKIKATSKAAIQQLQNSGISVIMLTGDNHNTAAAVAKELNLLNFKAGMLPQDKLIEVEKLQAHGKKVAMAGDGINDAPALAKSDVGIAMGTGTDVAIESAMITLVKGDLQGIVKAKNLSDKVMRNIKQNLFFAFVYNSIGIPIAAGLLYPFFGILLSPMIAAAAMSFSSVSVIANSLRLRTVNIS